jgi:hypothetical protein
MAKSIKHISAILATHRTEEISEILFYVVAGAWIGKGGLPEDDANFCGQFSDDLLETIQAFRKAQCRVQQ